MTQSELESIFTKGLRKEPRELIVQQISRGEMDVDVLFNACLNPNSTVAMKVSWVLGEACKNNSDLLEDREKQLVEMLEESPVQGVRRELIKMIILCYPWSKETETELLDLCMVLTEAEETATAEKYFSMKIMGKIGHDYWNLFQEYLELLEAISPFQTNAFQRQAAKFLAKHRDS
ncbi:MAG: hypothetical protein HRT74_00665 [Flavobacteriales bacterium]|nr:hypothetical protein [Flavobacteriales bacterium]